MKEKYKNSIIRNDICYAVTNRQNAVKNLTKFVEIIIVVGSETSSNCVRLKEMSESHGTPSFLINSVEEIKDIDLNKYTKIGITSGASTPEVLIDEFISYIQPSKIDIVGESEKDINFVLPDEV